MRWMPMSRSGAIHGEGVAAVSRCGRAAVPNPGIKPPQDHAESTLEKETPAALGRLGATLSRIKDVLALSRAVEKKRKSPLLQH
jgi:hypothetical protein